MKTKILIIDNTFDPPHGSPEIQRRLQEAAESLKMPIELVVARAPESKIPTNFEGINGVVISGSKTRINENAPWIELEMDAIRKLKSQKIPTFGICYGEQLTARAFGGEVCVGETKTPEHGWAYIKQDMNAAFPLFKGLKEEFVSYEFHFDEVRALPPGFKLSATNAACKIQAYEISDAPFWCVQFHPERELAIGNKSLDDRLSKDPNYNALNRKDAEKIFDPGVGKTIFMNFLNLVKDHGK